MTKRKYFIGFLLVLLVLSFGTIIYVEAQTSPTGGGSPTTPAAFCKISGGWKLCDSTANLTLGADLTVAGNTTFSGITGSTQCLQVNSSGVVSGTGAACGSGGGGGDSVWSRNATTALISHPTTTDFVAIGLTSTTTHAKLTVSGLTHSTGGFLSSAASSTIAFLRVPNFLGATTSLIDTLSVGTSFIIDANTFDSLTDDATLDNNSGDLRVVDVTCTDCLSSTEIGDEYLFNTGDTGTGLYIFTDLRSTSVNATSSMIGTLNLNGGSITNYFGTACSGNQWLQDIADNGAFSCGALDVTGNWTGTLDGDDAANFARVGVNGNWHTFAANVLAPTNTSASILVPGSSSTIAFLRVPNVLIASSTLQVGVTGSTGTSTLVYGGAIFDRTDNTLVINASENRVGILTATPSTTLGVLGTTRLNGAATISGVLTLTGYNCSGTNGGALTADANGLVTCTDDDSAAGAASPGAWETLFATAITPTSTSNGIFVYASSTFDNNLRVNGTLTLTSAVGTKCLDEVNGVIGTVDSDCGPPGQNGLWQAHTVTDTITPTNTSASIVVQGTSASSTFAHSLVVDTSTLVANASENRVGIGTAVPTHLLTVNGTASSTIVYIGDGNGNSAPSLTFGADTDTGFLRPAANTLYFVTNGVPIFMLGSASSTVTIIRIADQLQIPSSTAPTLNTTGQIAWDGTGGDFVAATGTAADFPVVLGSATTTLYSFIVASTSPDFLSGGIMYLPTNPLKEVVTAILCFVDGGTSQVINLSNDAGNADTNTVTCTTTRNFYNITSNATANAYAGYRLEFGTKTGTIDYLIVRVLGRRIAP